MNGWHGAEPDPVVADREVHHVDDQATGPGGGPPTGATGAGMDAREATRSRYARLAGHSDPLLAEIGGQLAAGTVRPAELWTVGPYRRRLSEALDGLHEAVRTGRTRLPEAGPVSGE